MMSASNPDDIAHLEVDARASALKQVCNMLQRPDQLEKIDQYKRRLNRKKASVDAMLKTALQSQLDGVKDGLANMRLAVNELDQVKDGLDDVKNSYKSVESLYTVLKDLREENLKHIQYAAAKDNLKHIFTVPEIVDKCRTYILEGKLLMAHKALMDLENSRDELMFELHRLPQQSPTDRNTLKHYFNEVDKLSDELAKQLFLVLQRSINTVRKEPTALVTVLRIIEREERLDAHWKDKNDKTGFMPQGRLKRWREKALKTMEHSCITKVDCHVIEDRQSNKMWLVKQLEMTRILLLEDLKVAKNLLPNCFPPSYEIFDKYVMWYHSALAAHFRGLIKEGLEGSEIIPMLSWLNIYKSHEMLLHPDLEVDVAKIPDLLEANEVEELIQRYLDTTRDNMTEWMKNSLTSDKVDWFKEKEPESDGEGYYHTSLPVIVFQMIEEHLQVANTISDELTARVFQLCLDQLKNLLDYYRAAIQSYKNKHFEDRKQFCPFTLFTIAAINNCGSFQENLTKVAGKYGKQCKSARSADFNLDKQVAAIFEKLNHTADETINYLLDEMFLDLDAWFTNLITKTWMASNESLDTICVTIEDYTQDYIHMKPKYFQKLMEVALDRVVANYIKRLLSRSITFTKYEERLEVGEKICRDSDQIKALFIKIGGASFLRHKQGSPTDVLPILAEVLKLKDPTMMSLELGTLVNKYPDIQKDHLVALLYLRSDLKGTALQLVNETLGEDLDEKQAEVLRKGGINARTVFSLVKV